MALARERRVLKIIKMNSKELCAIINAGETSRVQFKREIKAAQSADIIAEMVAMSNYEGGRVIIGVSECFKVVIKRRKT